MKSRVLALAVASGVLAGAATPALAEVRLEGPGVSLLADLPEKRARAYLDRVVEDRRKVEAWWGTPFAGRLRVEVSRSARVSMALVPAWRGDRGKVLTPRYRAMLGNDATLHEIVHVVAPNQNRFLAEGLASYAHDLLASNPAFPNFGADMDGLAREVGARIDLRRLDAVAVPRPLSRSGYELADAYIAGASFVGFLIGTYGMDSFRRLYALTPLTPGKRTPAGDPGRWTAVYGKALPALGREWRIKIGARSRRR